MESEPHNLLRGSSAKDKEETEVSDPDLTISEFIEGLTDTAKFYYAGLCATTLNILFNAEEEKDYRHNFVTSFVAHLCLPSNVANTMQALCDGHGAQETKLFVDALVQDEETKSKQLMIASDLITWAVTSFSGRYDARTRVAIRHITRRLLVKFEEVEDAEERLIVMLRESTEKEKAEQEDVRKKKARTQKIKRFALIGLATAGGGALIGLTGGLAAPLVAAGAGAILGGASAAALGSVAGLAVITSLFGAAGAGLTGYKMKQRVGGIDEFLFRPLSVSKQLAATVAVSGWLSKDSDSFVVPWLNMLQSREQYCLVWESKHLMRLGTAFEYILDSLVSVAATEALKLTVFAGLITAIAWPASLLAAASVIDNPWSVCLQRSAQVGRQLAEVLLAREHGHRPITLIGFSLGARVIYHCLEELSKRKNHRGIIEDVYLLGAPVSGKEEHWRCFSTVVSGQITNAYCRTDWLLRFLYRTSSRQVQVAGLQPVMWENRRMVNIDLSSIVEGHMDYAKKMDDILAAVGVRTKDKTAFLTSEVKAKESNSHSNLLTSDSDRETALSSWSCDDWQVVDVQPLRDSANKESNDDDPLGQGGGDGKSATYPTPDDTKDGNSLERVQDDTSVEYETDQAADAHGGGGDGVGTEVERRTQVGDDLNAVAGGELSSSGGEPSSSTSQEGSREFDVDSENQGQDDKCSQNEITPCNEGRHAELEPPNMSDD